jgi:hypothetical protein
MTLSVIIRTFATDRPSTNFVSVVNYSKLAEGQFVTKGLSNSFKFYKWCLGRLVYSHISLIDRCKTW